MKSGFYSTNPKQINSRKPLNLLFKHISPINDPQMARIFPMYFSYDVPMILLWFSLIQEIQCVLFGTLWYDFDGQDIPGLVHRSHHARTRKNTSLLIAMDLQHCKKNDLKRFRWNSTATAAHLVATWEKCVS